MVFVSISKEEAIRKFEKAKNKNIAITLIADLTAGSRQEVADFLGVKLLDKRQWAVEQEIAKTNLIDIPPVLAK